MRGRMPPAAGARELRRIGIGCGSKARIPHQRGGSENLPLDIVRLEQLRSDW